MGVIACCENNPAAFSPLACAEIFPQAAKLIFGKPGEPFADTAAFDVVADFETRIAASDETQIWVTPGRMSSFDIPQSEPNTFGGGDNTTPEGKRIVLGPQPVTASAEFLRFPQSAIDEIRQVIECSAISDRLGIIIVGVNDEMAYDSPDGTVVDFIPISGAFLGSPQFGNRQNPTSNLLNFELPGDWARNLKTFKPANVDLLSYPQ